MIYDDDVIKLELARLRSRRPRHAERMSINQEVLPAIKILSGHRKRFGREDIMDRTALAAPLSALAASTAFADLSPPAQPVADQYEFWNRLHRRLCMSFCGVDAQPADKTARQIFFAVAVAVLFVIGGLVQIWGMLP